VEERISGQPGADRPAWREWHEILTEPASPEEARLEQRYLKRRPVLEPLSYLAARCLYGAARVLLQLRVDGRELLPRDVPMLLCPNHNSYVDDFLLPGALPFALYRRLFFLGASKYFNRPILGWVGRIFRIVPVDADTNLRKALRLGSAGLRKGMVLCVFPEGGRSIDGTLRAFRKGPAILAAELQVPLVPVGIRGTFEVWGRGAERIHLHPVRILIGRPVVPDAGSMNYDDLTTQLFEAVRAALDGAARSAKDVGGIHGL
jgi:long-chain acyl-CoA synthetase